MVLSFLNLLFLVLFSICSARIHKLSITQDVRKYIELSSFGFLRGGTLQVNLTNFHVIPENDSELFGFSLVRSQNDGINPYLESQQDTCILERPITKNNNTDEEFIYLIMDLKNNKLQVKCANSTDHRTSIANYLYQDKKRTVSTANSCRDINFVITPFTVNDKSYYNTSFLMSIDTQNGEGLFNLFFHNCPNYNPKTPTEVNCQIQIIEQNRDNYLSAGEIPLPALYFMMSILFFLAGMFWVFILRQTKHTVFKIHYMMAVLVFLKAISLAFHGVNYHYIQKFGTHLATWAILFYIAHLLKGALLFVVLVLIGTGWTFIKHVLTPKDKKLFMVVIPLQVLANIAAIILDESEEADREYWTWKHVMILVDLLCCGCILFPVVWSIRHLQEASETDGKAAINLRKLKLFRHFYVMVVCYIYSTRIIVYLLSIAVSFQYGWWHEMFHEMATYVFFVLTAYKFRPESHNPYFALSDDEDDVDEVLTESGVTEGLKRVNSRLVKIPIHQTITEVTEEEKDALLGQSESSHDYD